MIILNVPTHTHTQIFQVSVFVKQSFWLLTGTSTKYIGLIKFFKVKKYKSQKVKHGSFVAEADRKETTLNDTMNEPA